MAQEDLEDIGRAARELLDLYKSKRLTVVTAESCTGGLVASALTEIPGSSVFVDRGFVTYTNEAKEEMLGVPHDTLEPVSYTHLTLPTNREV